MTTSLGERECPDCEDWVQTFIVVTGKFMCGAVCENGHSITLSYHLRWFSAQGITTDEQIFSFFDNLLSKGEESPLEAFRRASFGIEL